MSAQPQNNISQAAGDSVSDRSTPTHQIRGSSFDGREEESFDRLAVRRGKRAFQARKRRAREAERRKRDREEALSHAESSGLSVDASSFVLPRKWDRRRDGVRLVYTILCDDVGLDRLLNHTASTNTNEHECKLEEKLFLKNATCKFNDLTFQPLNEFQNDPFLSKYVIEPQQPSCFIDAVKFEEKFFELRRDINVSLKNKGGSDRNSTWSSCTLDGRQHCLEVYYFFLLMEKGKHEARSRIFLEFMSSKTRVDEGHVIFYSTLASREAGEGGVKSTRQSSYLEARGVPLHPEGQTVNCNVSEHRQSPANKQRCDQISEQGESVDDNNGKANEKLSRPEELSRPEMRKKLNKDLLLDTKWSILSKAFKAARDLPEGSPYAQAIKEEIETTLQEIKQLRQKD
eukprot:131548-Hanusia_phi.AAC.1